MHVAHYFEWERFITGGHAQSVYNQRKIMEQHGIDYTTKPRRDADLLHLNNMGPRSVLAAQRARRNDVPVLIHAHQTAEDFKNSFALSGLLAKPMRPYLEYAYSLADRLICPSEHNRDVIETYTDVPKTVISNGFDATRLDGHETLRDEYLEEYDLEPPVVFTVGHVIKRKGLDTFTNVADRMPGTDFAWFGYINPTGHAFDRFLKSRETVRLVNSAPENCEFTGYVEDIRGAYGAGDIFFFPTLNENEGMALLEAMACGKPVVVRDIPTYEGWLEHGENCLKADSAAGFQEQLTRLQDDPELRERLGENAAATAEQYTLDAVGDELVDVYETLCAGR